LNAYRLLEKVKQAISGSYIYDPIGDSEDGRIPAFIDTPQIVRT
jgi:hypothetical protein